MLSYDGDDNVVRVVDQNGSVHSHSYDVLNRLVRTDVTRAAGVIGSTQWTSTYDGLSRRVTATDDNDPSISSDDATVAYRYGSLNRVIAESNNGQTATARYDGLGHTVNLVYPSGRQLNFSYGAIYNLKAINEADTNGANVPGSAIVEHDYAARRVLERRAANGTVLRYHADGTDTAYDGINRVLGHRHVDHAEGVMAAYGYAYDKANNRRFELDERTNTAAGLRI